MGFYDHFSHRQRNSFGVNIKKTQARKLFDLAVSDRNDKCRILEIGPGDGDIAELSRLSGVKYKGVEASHEVADKLKASGNEIIIASVPPLPADLGEFDSCFMLHVIEHLDGIDSASRLLTEIRNVLKNNGKLVVATPDYTRWKLDFYNCDYTHSLPFTARRLSQLLVNVGFTVTHKGIYVGPVFGKSGLPLYWIARLAYSRLVDDILGDMLKSDIWYRGYLTFLPNLIFVARKDEGRLKEVTPTATMR